MAGKLSTREKSNAYRRGRIARNTGRGYYTCLYIDSRLFIIWQDGWRWQDQCLKRLYRGAA